MITSNIENCKAKIGQFYLKNYIKKQKNGCDYYYLESSELKKGVFELTILNEMILFKTPKECELSEDILNTIFVSNLNTSHIEQQFQGNITEKRYLFFALSVDLKKPEAGEAIIRQLTDSDKKAFWDLKERTTKDDDEVSFVELDHPVVFGCFFKDQLVAVSSNLNWGDDLCDIGILTDKQFRRKGYGKATVAALCNYNAKHGKINQYRCTDENFKSYKTAQSLGFKNWGLIYTIDTNR
jgi:RimJ/RimL family protein N-acetyltransferase